MSLLDVQLHRVETADEAAEFMRWLGERKPVLGYDTETTGLDWWTPNFLRTTQFADSIHGWTIGAGWRGLAKEALTKYTGPVAYLNAKFDMHASDAGDLPLPQRHQIHDVGVMHCLLDPLARHGLKDLGDRYVDPSASMGQRMLKAAMKQGDWTWATIPEEVPAYGLYGAIDPILNVRLYEIFMPQVQARYVKAYEREMAAINILYRTEKRGIRIDTKYTEQLRDKWIFELAELKMQLKALGIENPNANRQIEDALVAAGWEPDDFTATGQAKLDKKTLATILGNAQLHLAGETVRLLTEYKQKRKWKATYLETFLNNQDANGYVHPDIKTMQARTGRMSVTRPAMQTLPKDPSIRGCILPNDGESIYAIDYDSQEARLMIHYAKETALGDVVRSGKDMHCYIASEVYGEVITDKEDPRRQLAKNTLYALMYGAGARKIAATSGSPEAEVQKFIDKMNINFPGIRRFMDETDMSMKMRMGSPDGRPAVTTWGGRDVEVEPDKTYKGVNALIQGTAADVIKEKIIALDSAGLADNLMMVVHDENLFSFPDGPDGLEMAQKAKDIMEEYSFDLELTCSLSGPFENWGAHYVK